MANYRFNKQNFINGHWRSRTVLGYDKRIESEGKYGFVFSDIRIPVNVNTT